MNAASSRRTSEKWRRSLDSNDGSRSYRIVPAIPKHVPALVRMARLLHEQHGWTGPFQKTWKSNYFEHTIKSDDRSLVMSAVTSSVPEQAIGYAVAYLQDVPAIGRSRCHINELFVQPDWRRHGVGRQLLISLMEWACVCEAFEVTACTAVDNAFGTYKLLERLGLRCRAQVYALRLEDRL
jgi:GNAT superfamily N-acetyltransferase